jgi:putative salt-induced outer membrane protein
MALRPTVWVFVQVSCIVFWVAAATPARAAWSGKAEAGLVVASGNTDTKSANAKLDMASTLEKWKHAAGFEAVYAASDGRSSGQRWEVHEQSDYSFSARNFGFGAARYENDRFSGFQYQTTVSGGVGRHFIDTERTKLTGTAGVGYKFFETRDTFDDDTGVLLQDGSSGNEAVFRGTLDFSRSLTATTRLLDKFLVESGTDNTFVQNDIAIQVKVSDVLALAAGYSVRRNTDPPPGFGQTDTLTTLNLVYEMK